MINSISFCILHFGQSDASLDACISGIRAQNIADSEIIVCGMEGRNPHARYIRNADWARSGELNMMRNALCADASKAFIVFLESDIELSPGWYENISGADCFDIAGGSIRTPGGARCVDWARAVTLGNVRMPYPLQYDEWTDRAYIRAWLMLMRKSVWDNVKFDWGLSIDKDDDVDFCLRAAAAGYRLGVFPDARAVYRGGAGKYAARRHVTFEEPQRIADSFTDAFDKGKTAFDAKDYDRALSHFEKAAVVVPASSVVWSRIGWSHYYKLRYAGAIKAFSAALELSPNEHYALRGRGWSYIQTGKYAEAAADLLRALEHISGNEQQAWHEAVRGLGWAHYHSGNFDEAIKSFTELAQRTDEKEKGIISDALSAAGWSHFRKDGFFDAVVHFNRALGCCGPDMAAHAAEALRGLELCVQKQKEAHLGAPAAQGVAIKWARLKKLKSSIRGNMKRLKSGGERFLAGITELRRQRRNIQ